MAGQETVGQRFVQLIAHLGISKNAFAVSLGKTATVIQHLVDERNKPGFDLLDKVFEVYPNVSMAWLMKGVGPMFTSGESAPESTKPEVLPTPVPEKKPSAPKLTLIPAAEKAPSTAAITEKPTPAPAEEQSASIATPISAPAAAIPEPVVAPVPVAAVAPVTAPLVAAATTAPAADTSWQTALYTQQMAHQLALAELRNQHLQEQQRLMQQMMDLMQRQLAR